MLTLKYNRFASAYDAVCRDGLELANVSSKVIEILSEKKAYELHMAAVSNNGLALRYVDPDYQSKEMIKKAVTGDYNSFEFSAVKDTEMYKWAIYQNPNVIKFIFCTPLTGDLEGQNTSDLSSESAAKLRPLIMNALMYSPDVIKHFSKSATVKMWEFALKKNSSLIKFHPAPTHKMVWDAIHRDASVIKYLDPAFIDESVQMYAAKENPENIINMKEVCPSVQEYVVKRRPDLADEIINLSEDACMYIVENHPEYIKNLHGPLTEKVRRAIVKYNPAYFPFIMDLPVTEDEILEALKLDGLNLRYLSGRQTKEMTEAALESNPSAYMYVDEQTSELFDMAAEKCPEILQSALMGANLGMKSTYIPSDEQIMRLISGDGLLLRFVPADYQNEALCMEACSQNIKAFEFVKNSNSVLNEKALSADGTLIRFIASPTDDEKLLAVETSAEAIKYIKEKNEELCLKAVKCNPDLLSVIDDKYRTPEVCMTALKLKPEMITVLSSAQQTPEMCEYCIEKDYKLYKYAFCQNEKIAEILVKADALMWEHVWYKSKRVALITLDSAVSIYYSLPAGTARKPYGKIISEILSRYTNSEIIYEQIDKHPELIRYMNNPESGMIIRALEKDIRVGNLIKITDTVWKRFLIKNPEKADEMPVFIPSVIAGFSDKYPEYISEKHFTAEELCRIMEYRPKLIKNISPDAEGYDDICLAAIRADGDAVSCISKLSERVRAKGKNCGSRARYLIEEIEYNEKLEETKRREKEKAEKLRKEKEAFFSENRSEAEAFCREFGLPDDYPDKLLLMMFNEKLTVKEYVKEVLFKSGTHDA